MFGVSFAFRVARLFFLDMSAVRQDQTAQVFGSLSTMNLSGKASTNKCWKIGGMIQMSMSEKNGVDRRGTYRKRFAIAISKRLEALKQSAIDKNAALPRFDQIPRASDGPCSTEETKRFLIVC